MRWIRNMNPLRSTDASSDDQASVQHSQQHTSQQTPQQHSVPSTSRRVSTFSTRSPPPRASSASEGPSGYSSSQDIKIESNLLAGTSFPFPGSGNSMLTNNAQSTPPMQPPTPRGFKARRPSVRSILKEPNTPGTGQNVRFFHGNSYHMISPNQSRSEASSEPHVPCGRPVMPHFANVSLTKSEASVLHTLKDDSNGDRSARGNVSRAASERSVIASLADASEASVLLSLQDHTAMPVEHSRSFSLTLPANHGSNLFDMSLDMPPIASSSAAGLMSYDPIEIVDYDLTRSDGGSSHRASISRKAVDHSLVSSPAPSTIRSAHSIMGPPTPAPILRSGHNAHLVPNSPSFISAGSAQAPRANISSSMVEVEADGPELQAPTRSFLGSLANITWSNPPIPGAFNFSSFFTHANSSSSSSSSGSSSPRTPSPKPLHALELAAEPDLDDEASAIISAQSELIRSLREQLAVQEDLSAQCELDLNSRDEWVKLLADRCDTAEAALSHWHEHGEKQSRAVRRMTKRITELERMCTRLQDEVDHSRSESLERSIMDETSGQALKTLHRQILTLEDRNRELVLDSEERGERIRELEASEEGARAELEQLKTHIDELEGTNAELREQLELQPAAEAPGLLHRNMRKLEDELAMVKDELEVQWEYTEKAEEKVLKLQEEKADLKREVEDLRRDLGSKNLRIGTLEASNLELDAQVDDANERTQQFEVEHEKALAELMESHDTLKRKFEANMRERDTDFNRIRDLEDILDTRQSEFESLQEKMDDGEAENVALRSELARKDADGNRRTAEIERQVKDKTSEVERLRSRVREIAKQNADLDLKVVSLTKELDTRTMDLNQLDIALDAKQQELNMIKRKDSVKGTGGINTPATALRDKAQAIRRESSLFGPTPKPRPSAVSSMTSGETPTPRPSAHYKSTLGSSTTSVGTNTTTGGTIAQFAKSIAPPPREREPIARPRSSLGSPTPAYLNAQTAVPAAGPASGRRSALGTSDTGSVRKSTKENRPLSAVSNASASRTARRSWFEPA